MKIKKLNISKENILEKNGFYSPIEIILIKNFKLIISDDFFKIVLKKIILI